MENDKVAETGQRREVERNFRAFRTLLPALLKNHANKFALMRDEEVVDFFDTSNDAFVAGTHLYEDRRFSIQEVTDQPVDLGYLSHAGLVG